MPRFLCLFLALAFSALSASAQVAVNPITNRVYVANEDADTVSVINGATGATIATVPVGDRPVFIAVNPFNNRIYVNNTAAASLSVIDGANNSVVTYPIGSTGPIAINPVTGKVFIVRFSTAAADEATIFDEATNNWYSVALDGFAPNALAVNTVANQLIVSAYASGEIRRIDASSSADHPPTTPIGVWSKPVAVAVNPVNNRIYSLQDDSRGPIAIITADNEAGFLSPSGHAVGPKAVAVNPITNRIYTAFAGEVIVFDGSSLIQTFIPSGTSAAGPVGLGINMLTNKIYVPNANGTLTVIDGATNATSTLSIPTGATGIAVNPITNRYYVTSPSGVTIINGNAGDTRQSNPIATTITPLPSNTSATGSGSITLNASSSFAPSAPQILGVYYQLDGETGPWLKAGGSGPYTASFSGLSPGSHTIRAVAADSGITSNMNTQHQNTPLVGTIATYTFTVGGTPPPNAVLAIAQASYSVGEGASQVQVQVNRSGGSTGAVSVAWTTANGTALAGSDFGTASSSTQPSGTLDWAAGDTAAKTITVPILNDTTNESSESFTITIFNPSAGAELGSQTSTTVTIADDDTVTPPASTFRFGVPTVTVGASGGNTVLQVIRDGPTDQAASVTFATADGTALQRSDYLATTGVLQFAAGVASIDIAIGPAAVPAPSVRILANRGDEPDETFTINLTGPSGASLGSPTTASITIAGAPPPPSVLQFSAATASIGENAGSVVLSIVRSGTATNAASVQWTTADGTAIAGTDYGTLGAHSQIAGSVSWAAGESGARTVTIPILDDTASEGAKVFTVNLSNADGGSLGSASTASVTINDNDAPPVGVAFSSPTYSVSEAGTQVVLTVNRVGDARTTASVRWAATNGSALAGRDFGTPGSGTLPSGALSWRAGETAAKTIAIRVLDDALTEGDLQFGVILTTPAGTTIASPGTATVTITDDDIPAESTFSVAQGKYLVMENAGEVTIGVNRTALAGGGFSRPASVSFSTVAGTALAGSDFTARTGTLSWGAGESGTKTFTVAIANDAIAESPEAFIVRLAGPSAGASVTQSDATVLIVDDDEVFPALGAFPDGWTTPAAAAGGWSVSNEVGAFEGAFSLRSDPVGDGEAAQVEMSRTFAAGSIAFRVRVSSEAGFDFLRFYVDGVKAGEWSGTANTAWQAFTTPITAGAHTLRWSYEKDGSASLGTDAAWIDAVTLPPAP